MERLQENRRRLRQGGLEPRRKIISIPVSPNFMKGFRAKSVGFGAEGLGRNKGSNLKRSNLRVLPPPSTATAELNKSIFPFCRVHKN